MERLKFMIVVWSLQLFIGFFMTNNLVAQKKVFMNLEDNIYIDLSGQWQVIIDSLNLGFNDTFGANEEVDYVELPGSIQKQGFGLDLTADLNYTGKNPAIDYWKNSSVFAPYRVPGNIKLSWALTPSKFYVGPVFFQRKIIIPDSMNGKDFKLFLERPHWISEVWIDNRYLGKNRSLSVPHVYESGFLSSGEHILTIGVDNSMQVDVGVNAQSVTDHTQTNWNGITGSIKLIPKTDYEISQMQIYPDIQNNSFKLNYKLKGNFENVSEVRLELFVNEEGSARESSNYKTVELENCERGKSYGFDYVFNNKVKLWDEFNPNLYKLKARLVVDKKPVHELSQIFGMRDVKTFQKQIQINGKNIFLRGTLQNAQYPETGYAPMDVDSWRKRIMIAKNYGLNHFRFHSWCPPEAAFIAADELGFYFQIEGPTWTNINPGTEVADYIYQEIDEILNKYGNHPSFIMLAAGNEIGGDNGGRSYKPDSLLWYQLEPPVQVKDAIGAAYLYKWVEHFKEAVKGRQIVTSSSGWPYIKENDFHVFHEPFRMRNVWQRAKPDHRLNFSNLVETHDVPLISHETGQWCAYPNLLGNGSKNDFLQEKNLEIFSDFARKNGVYPYSEEFYLASGKFQLNLYKQEIEMFLRTPNSAGFQLLGLADYHGHGFAPVGVLDTWYNQKDYCDPLEFKEFCSPLTFLHRTEKMTWENNELFKADIAVSNYSGEELYDKKIKWEISDSEKQFVRSGHISIDTIKNAQFSVLDSVSIPLKKILKASQLTFSISFSDGSYLNNWKLWVYPSNIEISDEKNYIISRSFDQTFQEAVSEGKNILFIPQEDHTQAINPGRFEPIFWSTWQGTGTLGTFNDKQHPVFNYFPTDEYTDWQWWELLRTSLPLNVTGVKALNKPVMQVIDNWLRANQLGLLFEFKLGSSSIFLCAMDIETDLNNRIVARQLRYSINEYMNSEQFKPLNEITFDEFRKVMGKPAKGLSAIGAKVYASQEFPLYPSVNLIDGDMNSSWQAGSISADSLEIVIELPEYKKVKQLLLHTQKDSTAKQILNYKVFFSHDGTKWGNSLVTGQLKGQAVLINKIDSDYEQNTRFIRLLFRSEYDRPVDHISISEIDIEFK